MGPQQKPNSELSVSGQPAIHKTDGGDETLECGVDTTSTTYTESENSVAVSSDLVKKEKKDSDSCDKNDGGNETFDCVDATPTTYIESEDSVIIPSEEKDTDSDSLIAMLNRIEVRFSPRQRTDMLRLRNNLKLTEVEREIEETFNACQASRTRRLGRPQHVIIRADGLHNLAMRPEQNVLKMSFLKESETPSFVFCQQNLGRVTFLDKEGAEQVYEMWAFRHLVTGEYLVVHKSGDRWEPELLPIEKHTSHSLAAPSPNTTFISDNMVAHSSSVRSDNVEILEQDCKFLLNPETNGAVAIIPLSLRQENKCLGYRKVNTGSPVDVVDGCQANFRIIIETDQANSHMSFETETTSLSFQRSRKQYSSMRTTAHLLVFLRRVR